MIGCTKLLCGTATVSEIIKHSADGELPPQLLQFSDNLRPLVVWNVTNRCNLRCRHCYIEADDLKYSGELSTTEAVAMIEDLAGMKVPVLLFSGGEPLLRDDIFELGHLAGVRGLRPVISSNGTLIDKIKARRIKEAGFQYVGISLDGLPETHDRFRNSAGSFARALAGIHTCIENGIKTGVRFTVNRDNLEDLPGLLDIVQKEGIPRFCMYHLVYAGRGREMMELDINKKEKRDLLEYVAQKTIELYHQGVEIEILTTDNHADGIFLLNRVRQLDPSRAGEVINLLAMHGGCSAGTKFANIDPCGNVHPCQFWQDYVAGNIRQEPFSSIWTGNDPLLTQLREKNKHLKGRCGICSYNRLCGGCRIRARAVYGDLWQEDPACYLDDAEIYLGEG